MPSEDYNFCPFCHSIVEASDGEHNCAPGSKGENLADDARDLAIYEEHARNYGGTLEDTR